jgi:DNA-binding transcriptional MerR regulator
MRHLFTERDHETESYLLIGQVAEITGASCKAIRLYEAQGLLPTPKRRGKYRIYSEQDVFLVHMIKHGQTFGFTLAELREVAAAKVRERHFPLALANRLCDRKREAVLGEIAALRERERGIALLQGEMTRIFGAP